MLKVKTASETKRKFLEVLKEAQENPILVTRKGQPQVVILDALLYESLVETIKFLTYPEIAKVLEEWRKV